MADGPLAGQTALVTGGAKRIGEHICHALAAAGARVAVHARSSMREAENLAHRIGGVAVRADLADPEAAQALVADAAGALGAGVDLVVNNASIFPPVSLADATYADLEAVMRIHAWAPLAIARAAAAQGAHCAVNLLDTRIVSTDPQHFPYLLSKQALASLTRSLAVELSPMRVNGVAPGPILPANEDGGPPGSHDKQGSDGADAGMEAAIKATVLGRAGRPEEIAAAVRYLVEAEYVTGQVLFVDGGRHLRG